MELLFPSWLMSIAAFVFAYRYVSAVRADVQETRRQVKEVHEGIAAIMRAQLGNFEVVHDGIALCCELVQGRPLKQVSHKDTK